MVDWLELGFNLVIGLVALAILCSLGYNIKRMIEKQMKEDRKNKKGSIDKELEDDLDDFLGV